MNRKILAILAVVTVVALAGVYVASKSPRDAAPRAMAADPKYLLEQQPAGAEEVVAVRANAEDGQDVVVVGRIGGRVTPWIKGSAAFSIVDRSRKPCNELPGDTCKTPWDYCCEADLPKATLLVAIHDSGGQLVKTDARELLGVTELDTLVVQGNAKRDSDGNISIVASKVFVVPTEKE